METETEMTVPFRPLGIITEVVEQMGLEVTYAFEDLVFISHNAFLLRMGEKGEIVHLYFNEESEADKRGPVQKQLTRLGDERGLTIINSGTYKMQAREADEQLEIHFQEYENTE